MHDDTIREAWRDSGPYWEKYAPIITRFFEPLERALLDELAVERGHRVLDLAGGTGDMSEAAARRGASVVCSDLSGPMIAAARRRLATRTTGSADAVQCDACFLPFAPTAFDRVMSRLGVMFFPDTELATAEVLRVLRPGGRAAFVVWGTRPENPFFDAVSSVVSKYAPSQPDPPDAPTAWRFGEPGALAARLAAGGAADILESPLDFEVAADLPFDEFWKVRVEMSDSLRDKVAEIGPERIDAVRDEVRSVCAPYFATGHARFPARGIVVSFGK
jgi:SAM-dependent methyltransferase